MVPLAKRMTHDAGHAYAKRLAQRLAAIDERLITVADPAKRGGHIFVDYLRNGRGTTAVGTYSPRARPGFPVAAPLTWRQVENGVSPQAYAMETPFGPNRRRRMRDKSFKTFITKPERYRSPYCALHAAAAP